MLHAFGADEQVSQFLHVPRLASKQHHFQTVVAVQMGMEGGDYDTVVKVLQVS